MVLSSSVVLLSLAGLIVWTYIVVRRMRILKRTSDRGRTMPRNRVIVLDFLAWTFALTQFMTSLAFVDFISADLARDFATAERLVLLMIGVAIAVSTLHPEDPKR
jgi:hypothetical protein